MQKLRICFLLLLSGILTDLLADTADNDFTAVLITATDAQYPDNNMIGFRSAFAGEYTHNQISFKRNTEGKYTVTVTPGNGLSDTIVVQQVDLLEMMPSIPAYIKSNAYLTFLALLNQEWNRIQVRFNSPGFLTKGQGTEKNIITRIDIANNCLGKGKWELLQYASEKNSDLLYFQSWFTFPETVYNALFFERNGIKIDAFDAMLKNYGSAAGQKIELNDLRDIITRKEIPFENKNAELYPMEGERLTKAKNILYPVVFTSINDFLSDKTQFASFIPPGQYSKAVPRQTYLSRFQELKQVIYCTSTSKSNHTHTSELQLLFSDKTNSKSTSLFIGGLQLEKLPFLNFQTMQKGWQRPMGIANHSFYNAAADMASASSLNDPYFAMLLDANDMWLDSHQIGIDGILLYRDEAEQDAVHLLLLSFERHAFIGHYVFTIPPEKN